MDSLEISSVAAAEAVAPEVWSRLCPPRHPFLNRDFFAVLERHGAAGREWGWLPRHLVARRSDGSIVGILLLYLKGNSFGDFTHDWAWASAYRQLGREYYPKMLTGLPHTPARGPRLLVAEGPQAPAIQRALIVGAKALVAEAELSSWHVAFPGEEDLAAFASEGMLVSHDVQFHWHDRGYGDFDGYLAAFSADKRRKVRAERRRVEASGLALEVRHGDEIPSREWPALRALYASTFDKFGNHAVFTAECFAELAATLGRRMVAFIARQHRVPVAVSLCFRSDEALYGRYWGCRGDYPGLHFELCFYQGIAYCLREGLVRFEPGAGGEHKIARGFEPTTLNCLHWIADPTMRKLLHRHLEREGVEIERYRQEAAEHLPFKGDAQA